jgi:hypothetical protein
VKRFLWLVMIPVLLLVTWMGTRALNDAPLWGDEVNTLRDARGVEAVPRAPADVWNGVGSRNPVHVPGYFIALSLWSGATGWTEPAVRMLALLLGIAAVALTFRLGRDLFGAWVGLYAAALLGTSMLFVHYLYHARMYTMTAFFTVLTLWVYLRIVTMKREPGIGWWLALLSGTVGLLYTHYIAALVLIPMGLYHIIFVRISRRWWAVGGVMIVAGLLFLPWLNLFRAGVEVVEDQETLHNGALAAPQVVAWLGYLFGNTQALLAVALLALALYATLRGHIPYLRRLWFLTLALLATILIVNSALEIISDKRARYLIGLWPLLALLGAVGLAQVDRWLPRLGTLLVVGWLAYGVIQSNGVQMNSDLDGYNFIYPLHSAAQVVLPRAQAGDMLINDVPDNRPEPKNFNDSAGYYFARAPLKDLVARGATLYDKNRADIEASARIWLAYETDRLPSNLAQLKQQLGASFQHCADLSGNNHLKVELYVRRNAACPVGGV